MSFRAITGNRLRDGAVVFYNSDAGWVERLNDASLYEDKATTETVLAAAKAQAEKSVLLSMSTPSMSRSKTANDAREHPRANPVAWPHRSDRSRQAGRGLILQRPGTCTLEPVSWNP